MVLFNACQNSVPIPSVENLESPFKVLMWCAGIYCLIWPLKTLQDQSNELRTPSPKENLQSCVLRIWSFKRSNYFKECLS